MTIFERLAAEFPRDAVHWRAQTLTKEGDKALALAYIDARDVMDRLDEVCGPAGWRDSYTETARGRVIGTIEILVDGEWVGKSDGAGDTDVEGDKGGMSDAFKRTAVKWGIGRYLYRMPNVWAACESYEKNGKKHWKKWVGSPWNAVRNLPTPPKADAPTSGDDSALILTLAQTAGVSIQTIVESYNVSALDELSAQQSAAVVKRLQLTIKDKQRENA